VAAGGTLAEAAATAARVGATVGNVFIVRALELARAGGRLSHTAADTEERGRIHVLTMTGATMDVIGEVSTVDEAAEAMATHVRAAGTALRAGVGFADRAASPLSDALHGRLTNVPEVTDLVRYRVGASVGAHTGAGTVGVMYYEPS
jgi:fatty acid-binding protein DegV